MRAYQVMLLALVLSLSSCAKKVDGSSEEAFKTSVSAMKDGLTEAEQEELGKSLMIISMKDMDFGAMMSGAQDADSLMSDARRSLDGKSREDIVQWAEEIRERREADQKEREAKQLATEIDEAKKAVEELSKVKAEADIAAKSLAAFKVENARFFKRKQRFGPDQPLIELKVTNGTGQPVSRAYFKGILKSPGRAVPWHEDTFNYEISGGLENGESQEWSLAPNMFSDWGSAEPGADAILHVEVTKLDGPGDKTLFDASTWGPDEEERLEKLTQFLADPTTER